jgi:hypothetical protein
MVTTPGSPSKWGFETLVCSLQILCYRCTKGYLLPIYALYSLFTDHCYAPLRPTALNESTAAPAGRDAAGRDPAGRDTAGRETAGRDTAQGRDTAGRSGSPEDSATRSWLTAPGKGTEAKDFQSMTLELWTFQILPS